jgi:putative ABC transport system substrate-binding protein
MAVGPPLPDAFRQGLRELGYVEGRDVAIDFRDAQGRFEQLPALARELVALKVDVIVVGGTSQALAAKKATSTIPIVFGTVGDPVTSGLVESLARPGGNATGLSNVAPELVGKRLELISQILPVTGRVAVLWQPGAVGEHTMTEMRRSADAAARLLGLQLHFVDVRDPADFEKALSGMRNARMDALTVLGGAMFVVERKRLVDLAAKYRLPTVYVAREFVDVGGLMSYGANDADLLRRAAGYVDRILKGARPGDLSVAQPTKFELCFNLRTAGALGISIPQSVLLRADRVIE